MTPSTVPLLAPALRTNDLVRVVSPSSTIASSEPEMRAAAQAFASNFKVRVEFAEHALALWCDGWYGRLQPKPV